MTSTPKKIFILDTHVILHDSACIHQFNEHDIIIPITVLDSHSNGLSYLIEEMKGQRLYAHVNLTKGERSELADLAGSLL